MSRVIDADKLKEAIESLQSGVFLGKSAIEKIIDEQPTVEKEKTA